MNTGRANTSFRPAVIAGSHTGAFPMKKKFALGLLAVLSVLALPTLAAAPTSSDLTVDDFFAGIVSTELVDAVKCPVQTLGCNNLHDDCGVETGICWCVLPAGTEILKCVKRP